MPAMRWFFCALALAASTLAVSAENPASPVSGHPNIILITMDTTRADRMGFMGSDRGLTPSLDAIAKDSTVFTHAYAQAPLTPASHASILTGTYPQYHQVYTFPIPLAKVLPYMPEILKGQGYHTAAFVGSMALDPKMVAPGFDRGFETYDAGFHIGKPPEDRYHTGERRAGDVVDHALEWLSKRPQGPFFVWIHFFDPHDPYDPPEPYKTRYAKDPYDGEIAYMDSALGKLFAQLKAAGLYDSTLMAITADHGESLGAHGEDQHGIFLYDETIHVPLVIKLPDGSAAGKRVDEIVESVDIMPTLLDRAGVPTPSDVQGASALGLMKAGKDGQSAAAEWRDRGAYSQSDYGRLSFSWSEVMALRTNKYLYVQAPRRELYDRTTDLGAQHNLAAASPAVADTLAVRVKDLQQKFTNQHEMPKAELDSAKIAKLSALGYFARIGNPVMDTSGEHGADPKDKIAVINTLLKVNDFLATGNCQEAVPELEKGIGQDSEIPLFHYFLGECYAKRGDHQKAADQFRATLKLDSNLNTAQLQLGRALMELRDFQGAAAAFEQLEKADPTIVDTHVYLVVAYAQLDRAEDDIRECRFVLKALPEHFGANFNLGRFLAKTGDLQGALPSLEKAASIRPESPGPHIVLAKVYSQLGREADAVRERALADRLRAAAAVNQPTANGSSPEGIEKQ